MKVNSEKIRNMRNQRFWSQEELGEACGLDLRTIQRIEQTGKASLDSIRRLAGALGVDSGVLTDMHDRQPDTPIGAILLAFIRYADFSGKSTRAEYWWYFLFVLLVCAMGTLIHPRVGQLVGVINLLPLVSIGTRRLQDTGRSGWWQLLFLVPFGMVVVFYLLAMKGGRPAPDSEGADSDVGTRP